MYRIDVNCDLGEGFGSYRIGADEDILPHVSSVNIACGFHAGDAATMRQMVHLAHAHGVGIGAHPGLPDLAGFGRRNMDISPTEAYDMVIYQIGALYGFCLAVGATLRHVKPHGALYNMAAKNRSLADAIARAVHDVDEGLILYALSGSELVAAGDANGLRTASEVFADRTYQQDGTLTSRSEPNALVTNHAASVNQVVRMVKEGVVRSQQGIDITIRADTVCIHGDGPNAVLFAKKIREQLATEQIMVQPI